ncbi:MAG: DNA polymerase III subunit beta [Candidatus Buchananbacteria bacterium RIFCSPHIGHO2_01_FULL_44_11]|uniref:Beta sliding clamp n=1 Tax=Candidatus Buchananbacteria bacterium RIFCSPHIGHO2_01_FULL_44_11 TaxID=1797535 RepID=A0A1G1Y271_9BACT|nr:MAG: DNA polymerase III subunit beta [Candidatus Buchananbacteria bacterium RIFCSPHIGHO2_01_FULL_44_11]
MKITCTQENLNQGLFVVSHLASKNTSLPILNNILFQVDKNTIKLSATNLEIGVSCGVRGKIEEPGDFTVQSRLLSDYISLLPKERVDLTTPGEAGGESQNQILEVKCKNHSTKIKGQSAADFPLIPQIEKKQAYTLKPDDFRQAISQVIFAVSVNETRPEINGISFNFTENKLVLATTDSYRLAEKTVSLVSKQNASKKIIVPTRTMQELLRILGSFKDPAAISNIEEIKIYLAENQILFTLDNIELISRLVEGQYPDYQQIIPTNNKTKVLVNVAEMIKATKTASLFARSGIYDVNLDFAAGQKEVVVSSTNSQLGENFSSLEAEFEGETNKIVVNYRYLLDGLQNINSEQAEISIIDGNNPCVLKPVGKTSDYLYIIMPIKQ